MKFGFNQKYDTTTQTPLGAAYRDNRLSAPLVKTGGGGGATGGDQSGGGGGGGNPPLGCPKCVGWYWIPLGAVGVMSTLAWLLARR